VWAQRAELELVSVLTRVQVPRKQTQRRKGSVPLGQQPLQYLRPSRRALPRRSIAQEEEKERQAQQRAQLFRPPKQEDQQQTQWVLQ
jgi:hypothetical protein